MKSNTAMIFLGKKRPVKAREQAQAVIGEGESKEVDGE